jgi:putative flippase GtrA
MTTTRSCGVTLDGPSHYIRRGHDVPMEFTLACERITRMKQFALRAWRRYRQQILYLVVGGWNTLFQYGVFSLMWFLLHVHLHPDLVLVLATLISSVNGFLGFRYVVFGPSGHPLWEYLKFQLVYGPILVLNMVVLPLMLRYTSVNAYVIQAAWGGMAIILAYFGNKYFTFKSGEGNLRRRLPPSETSASR